jgi:hypothetical protein
MNCILFQNRLASWSYFWHQPLLVCEPYLLPIQMTSRCYWILFVPCDLSFAHSSFPFTFVCYNEFFNAFSLGLQEAKYTYIIPKTILKKFLCMVDLKSQIALGKSSKIMILRSRKLGHCDGKCSKLTTIYHLLFFNMNFWMVWIGYKPNELI